MNPLHASWSRKKRAPEEPPKRESDPPFLGIRNEARQEKGPDVVVIEVRGVSGLPSGRYKLRYSPGASLRWYLRQLRMLNIATKVAIYDMELPSKGRLRLRYHPSPSSRIVLMPPGMSPSTHLQRSSVDAARVAAKMKADEADL